MKKKDKALNIVFYIFAFIGIIFVIAGIVSLMSAEHFKKNAVEVTGVISGIEAYKDSDGDTSHRVYVDYDYGGKIYEGVRLYEYSSSMYEGQKIDLMLDPENPVKIATDFGKILVGIMFIGMGAIFALVGIIPILIMTRRKKQKTKLLAGGRLIYATVESIALNTGYSVNGCHPYVIYCTYRDDYKDVVYRFRSENIWTNPEHVIKPGSEIRVYVDGADFSRYYVDAESILDGKIIDYT